MNAGFREVMKDKVKKNLTVLLNHEVNWAVFGFIFFNQFKERI